MGAGSGTGGKPPGVFEIVRASPSEPNTPIMFKGTLKKIKNPSLFEKEDARTGTPLTAIAISVWPGRFFWAHHVPL
jgi:hypothetical protein